MDEFERKKAELLRPLYFEAGAALMDCQHLEYGVSLLLYYFAMHGAPGLDFAALTRIMDNQDKKTLGQLIAMLKKSVQVSPGIETALKEGLDARNVIVHHVLADNVEQIPYPDKRAALVKEIRRLRRRVRDADRAIKPFIRWFSARIGLDQDEFEKKARELFS